MWKKGSHDFYCEGGGRVQLCQKNNRFRGGLLPGNGRERSNPVLESRGAGTVQQGAPDWVEKRKKEGKKASFMIKKKKKKRGGV